MNLFLYQLKQAFLSLKQKPGFVVSVVATMGIALGALLCVMTLAYVLLIKPLPYADQERLYRVDSQQIDAENNINVTSFSYPSLIHLYQNQQTFEQAALMVFDDEIVTSLDRQPTLTTAYVTPEWLALTANESMPNMALGRSFEQSERLISDNPVAILSFDTWQSEFAGRETVIGESITIRGANFTIIGVLAESFYEANVADVGRETQVWLPWGFNPVQERYRKRWWDRGNNLVFIGKLLPEISATQAELGLSQFVNDTWQNNIDREGFYKGWHIVIDLVSFKSIILAESQTSTYLLLIGALGLLIIASINIANLLLARVVENRANFSLSAAIGARKRQIYMEIFAESSLLMFVASLIALMIAQSGFTLIKTELQQLLPRVNELELGFFTLGCSLLLCLGLAGLFSWLAIRVINYQQLNIGLRMSGKGTGQQVAKIVRQFLIAGQVAVAAVLIFININLLQASLAKINDSNVINVENLTHVVLAQSDATVLSRAERTAIMTDIQQAISVLPQVDTVSRNSSPLTDGDGTWSLTEVQSNKVVLPIGKSVDQHYFNLMGQNIIAGDAFEPHHYSDRIEELVVNEQLATLLLEGKAHLTEVIGKQLSFGGPNAYSIIGVVNDHKLPGKDSIPPRVYLANSSNYNLLIKTKANQKISRETLVAVIESSNKSMGLFRLSTLALQKSQRLFGQYITALTTLTLTVLTILLSGIGLYGILSYATQMRRFEIGTRLAIGAKRLDLIRLVIKENIGAISFGVLVSIGVLLLLTMEFSSQFNHYFTLQVLPVFLLTLAFISVISFIACYLPLCQYINKPAIHCLKGND